MSLMKSLSKFARSRQGREMADKAMAYAKSPEGKAKIEQVRRQLGKGGKPKPR